MMKIVKNISSTSKKLKELMKAVKKAGGTFEDEIKARKILKYYLSNKLTCLHNNYLIFPHNKKYPQNYLTFPHLE